MPGAEERILRRRIGSVQNTKKITRAMELIAATRVAKAQMRANEARPYAETLTSVIADLAAGGAEVDHPLLREPESVDKVGFVVITSDRGLAGPYNANVIRAAERELMASRVEGADYSLVLIGKKAGDYFRFRHYRIDALYTGMSDKPAYNDAREVADTVTEHFESGAVGKIVLVYTEFVSMGTQRVRVRRFLPLETTATIAEAGAPERRATFEFEPSPRVVMESLLPRYVEARLYAALLDSAASEHASRQRAMKAATDNAEELILKLTRRMNQARQDAITTEIMEIIGGAAALAEHKGSEEDLLLDELDWTTPFPALGKSTFFAHNPER